MRAAELVHGLIVLLAISTIGCVETQYSRRPAPTGSVPPPPAITKSDKIESLVALLSKKLVQDCDSDKRLVLVIAYDEKDEISRAVARRIRYDELFTSKFEIGVDDKVLKNFEKVWKRELSGLFNEETEMDVGRLRHSDAILGIESQCKNNRVTVFAEIRDIVEGVRLHKAEASIDWRCSQTR